LRESSELNKKGTAETMSDDNKESPKLEGTEKVLDKRTTLLRPPEPDPNKAPIENTVEVTPLAVLGEVSLQMSAT
jgi:hypothetical protein